MNCEIEENTCLTCNEQAKTCRELSCYFCNLATEKEMKIEGRAVADCFDGDWIIKFDFGNFIITTGTTARYPEQAYRFALDKLPEFIDTDTAEAISLELVGIYGGF